MKNICNIFNLSFARVKILIFTLMMAFIVSGCDLITLLEQGASESEAALNKYCIDADDWGTPKYRVSAQASDLKTHTISRGVEITDWLKTGRVISDVSKNDLVITIDKNSKWSPWFGGTTINDATPSWGNVHAILNNRECKYQQNEKYQGPEVKSGSGLTVEERSSYSVKYRYPDEYVPCWLKNGYGLYIMTTNIDGGVFDKDAITYHLADTDNDGYLYNGRASNFGAKTGQFVQLKILDTYYQDNYGGYFVKIKRGTEPAEPGPIETVMNAFKEPIQKVIQKLYKGLVGEKEDGSVSPTSFTKIVQACILLYIVLYVLSYLLGMIGNTQSDFLLRLLKLGLVIQLISPGSWEFFNDYLFRIFTEDTIKLGMLLANPFAVPNLKPDDILTMLVSTDTFFKIISLYYASPFGFLYVVLFLVAIFIFIIALLKGIVLYLSAYVGFLLIGLAPIFIVAMLFGHLKRFFDEFLSQIISHSMQIIIVFAAIGMFGSILVYFMQQNLGFTVCYMADKDASALKITDIFSGKFDFKKIGSLHDDISSTHGVAWRPFTSDPEWKAEKKLLHMDFDGDGVITSEVRFVDLPYLDPVKDKARIDTILWEKTVNNVKSYYPNDDPQIVTFPGLVMFYIAVFMMMIVMSIIPSLSELMKTGGRSASAGLFGTGPWSPAGGIGGGLWSSGMGAIFGSKGSSVGASTYEGADHLSKSFNKLTGRSGGIAGGLIRGGLLVSKPSVDFGKKVGKKIGKKWAENEQNKQKSKFEAQKEQAQRRADEEREEQRSANEQAAANRPNLSSTQTPRSDLDHSYDNSSSQNLSPSQRNLSPAELEAQRQEQMSRQYTEQQIREMYDKSQEYSRNGNVLGALQMRVRANKAKITSLEAKKSTLDPSDPECIRIDAEIAGLERENVNSEQTINNMKNN